jgi:hypothetical protein
MAPTSRARMIRTNTSNALTSSPTLPLRVHAWTSEGAAAHVMGKADVQSNDEKDRISLFQGDYRAIHQAIFLITGVIEKGFISKRALLELLFLAGYV